MRTEMGKHGEEEKRREGREEKRRKGGGQEESVHRESICHLGSFHLHPRKRMEYSHSHSGMDLSTAIVSRENTPIDLPIGHLLEAFP